MRQRPPRTDDPWPRRPANYLTSLFKISRDAVAAPPGERQAIGLDAHRVVRVASGHKPTLLVLAIGETVPALTSDDAMAKFKAGVISLLRCALAKRHPRVVVRG